MFCVVCDCKAQSDYCFRHKPRKAMRKEAVKTKAKRQAVTLEWIEANPPDAYGYWKCYLNISPNCYRKVDIGELNIEHVESKARHPEQKYNVQNLRAACSPCNELKGSRSLKEVN